MRDGELAASCCICCMCSALVNCTGVMVRDRALEVARHETVARLATVVRGAAARNMSLSGVMCCQWGFSLMLAESIAENELESGNYPLSQTKLYRKKGRHASLVA